VKTWLGGIHSIQVLLQFRLRLKLILLASLLSLAVVPGMNKVEAVVLVDYYSMVAQHQKQDLQK
jgi:hypothetical protein